MGGEGRCGVEGKRSRGFKGRSSERRPGPRRTVGISAPACSHAHRGTRAAAGPAAPESGLRVGEGAARPAEGPSRDGRCGSASGLSRISPLLGLSWEGAGGTQGPLAKVAASRRDSGVGIQGSRPPNGFPTRQRDQGLRGSWRGPRVPEVAIWRFQI